MGPHMFDTWNLVAHAWIRALECAWACTSVCGRLRAIELGMGIFVSRVPTKDNIADEPSREKYGLLKSMKAKKVEPHLSQMFKEAQTWKALSVLRQPASADS